jgi:hypothetical protein
MSAREPLQQPSIKGIAVANSFPPLPPAFLGGDEFRLQELLKKLKSKGSQIVRVGEPILSPSVGYFALAGSLLLVTTGLAYQ